MATSPIEHLSGLVIGAVEAVAPAEVRVLLELDTPHTTALNTGTPVAFPRLNGYVLIPHEAGATVAYIAWMGIERSPYPKRAGLKDFGLIDLPFPLRKMIVSPIATLSCRREKGSQTTKYELSRGVVAFPSVGDQVLIPTSEQVEAIVGAKDTDKRVRIGVSPIGTNATIMVDPNKLFGRHLAVLGNTGSGKSCTVAGLIRWSLESAAKAIKENKREGKPNARFIVLDPNGEYAHAFRDIPQQLRLFKVPPEGADFPLDVPAWAMNGHEWTAISNAQPGAQRPLLMRGLRELKSGIRAAESRDAYFKNSLRTYAVQLSVYLQQGVAALSGDWKQQQDCGRFLERLAVDANEWSRALSGNEQATMDAISAITNDTIKNRRNYKKTGYDAFALSDIESILDVVRACIDALPDQATGPTISEDSPRHFDVSFLADHLDRIAVEYGGGMAGFVSTLGLRIRGMLSDKHLGSVINRQPPVAFADWLRDYVGDDGAENGSIAIVDLSLVPSEVVHIVVSVLGRLVFEALQRYRRSHPKGECLPTVLVLEEAHAFVKRGHDDGNQAQTASVLCRETFERIAREGRKFGLGLVVSSQRPSELSQTVLAQCNTFILHRIVNDSDQNLVGKLVPDNVAGLLADLPSLPSRQAIVLGWATPIPVLVDIDELPRDHRPHSSDPDFWEVWTLEREREIDWQPVVTEWAGSLDGDEPKVAEDEYDTQGDGVEDEGFEGDAEVGEGEEEAFDEEVLDDDQGENEEEDNLF